MKRCPDCNNLNPDDAFLCVSCGSPFAGKKEGYLYVIRWHLLALLVVFAMMGLLKYGGGGLLRDFGRIMSPSSAGRVEISAVRIYGDLTNEKVVEGSLRNLSGTDFKNLGLEVIAYNAEGKKLGSYEHPIQTLPPGKSISFLVRLPASYEGLNHANFVLREESAKELYLINRSESKDSDLTRIIRDL